MNISDARATIEAALTPLLSREATMNEEAASNGVTIWAHLGQRRVDVTKMVRYVYDLAVNSMDAGSHFWDIEDCQMARRLAVVLGADPEEAAASKGNFPAWAKDWPPPDESEIRALLGLSDSASSNPTATTEES